MTKNELKTKAKKINKYKRLASFLEKPQIKRSLLMFKLVLKEFVHLRVTCISRALFTNIKRIFGVY